MALPLPLVFVPNIIAWCQGGGVDGNKKGPGVTPGQDGPSVVSKQGQSMRRMIGPASGLSKA
jgi:hypothetical protein